MSENLLIALQITLIGMSLVFGVIVVLWIAMAVLVRVTTPRAAPIEAAAPVAEVDQTALKRKAAIAAVTVALANELTPQLHEFPEPPTSIVSVAGRAAQPLPDPTRFAAPLAKIVLIAWPPCGR